MNEIKTDKNIYLFTLGIIIFSIVTTRNLNILWFIVIGLTSLHIILKNWKSILKSDILIAIILGVLTAVNNPFFGAMTIPTYIASMTTIRSVENNDVTLYNHSNKGELIRTTISIFVIGGILSIVNLFLMRNHLEFVYSFKFEYLFSALRAGIFEEVFFRLFLYSIFIKLNKSVPQNKISNTLLYIVMVLPHVLIHFNGSIELYSVLILSLLFGLPFSIIMRRVNIISAIGSHAFVDLVRFIVSGGL